MTSLKNKHNLNKNLLRFGYCSATLQQLYYLILHRNCYELRVENHLTVETKIWLWFSKLLMVVSNSRFFRFRYANSFSSLPAFSFAYTLLQYNDIFVFFSFPGKPNYPAILIQLTATVNSLDIIRCSATVNRRHGKEVVWNKWLSKYFAPKHSWKHA